MREILALGPSRQGALRLRSTEVDAPFHNFSKSQGSQQRLSHLGCASAAWAAHQPPSEADHAILSFLKPMSSPDHNGNQSPQTIMQRQRRIHSNPKRKDTEMLQWLQEKKKVSLFLLYPCIYLCWPGAGFACRSHPQHQGKLKVS